MGQQQGGIRAATGAVNFAVMAYFLKFYHLKIFNSLQIMVEIIVRVQTLGSKEQDIFLCRQKIWHEFGTYLSDASRLMETYSRLVVQ